MEPPQHGIPYFSPTLVLPDIFNRFNFEYSVFSVLKVDSRRSNKKEKKEREKKEENSIQVGVNEHNQKQCFLETVGVCARTQISETALTHKFAAHKHIAVDHKTTITRQTINLSGTKTAPIQAEDLFFWSSRNFGHKNRSIFG